MRLLRLIGTLPTQAIILLVRGYQKFLSPLLGPTCRFHPTCSQYCLLAVKKHGAVTGLWKSVKRIGKCHPWHPGGVDQP